MNGLNKNDTAAADDAEQQERDWDKAWQAFVAV